MEQSISLNGALWKAIPYDAGLAQRLSAQMQIHPALAICLVQRGYQNAEAIQNFLHPCPAHLHNPYLMHDMDKAVERLKRAVQQQEATRVVTDYDADGTTSSLILQSTLELLGHKNFSYHIPHRMKEGYGFSLFAAQCAVEDGISLIVTADIGVRDIAAIDYAVDHGIDVIVLDHHLPEGAGVPGRAYAVLCPPQADCHYPNPALAACGISLKLAQALLSEAYPKQKFELYFYSLLKLAAIGTVADVVSLATPENRAIVKLGLDSLNHTRNSAGLRALLQVARCVPGQICSDNIGYRIGPRINAAGRLESASAVVDLIRCRDEQEAQNRALALDSVNVERQQLQEWMIQEAMQAINDTEAPFIIVALPESETWHRGVVGIVAGRIREQLNRPVALASICCGQVSGSIRSTPDVHAVKALDSAAQYLSHYGGHAAAAGFSLDEQNLEPFKQALIRSAVQQSGGEIALAECRVALEMSSRQLSFALCNALLALQPCGHLNEEPMICLRNVSQFSLFMIGEKHLRGEMPGENGPVSWIWFNAADKMSIIHGRTVDMLGHLRKEIWNNQESLKFFVSDMRLV